MLDWIPGQVWILGLIGLFGYHAVAGIYRELADARAESAVSGVVQEQWQPSRGLIGRSALLLSLIVLAVFIFTPAAERFAHSANVLRLTMAAVVAFGGYSTISGLIRGKVEPLSKGSLGPYSRDTEPWRYWLSMIWNGLFTVASAFLAVQVWKYV